MAMLEPEQWSIAFMQALISVFDLAIQNDGVRNRPAQVLTLARKPPCRSRYVQGAPRRDRPATP